MKTLDIAIVGGGTAGYMAAADLTRRFPDFRLYHIYDPRIPAIGVGEGTTPPFARWLHETTGLSFHALRDACDLTLKRGIRFENWGTEAEKFVHYFSPAREGSAYHISAARITALLRQYVRAEHVDRRVSEIESRESSARIVFEDGDDLVVDLVFDARGFPPESVELRHARVGSEASRSGSNDRPHASLPSTPSALGTPNAIEELAGIPTNAALVGRSPAVVPLTATRAVARPHGWIFVIPLTTSTSYGYVYNDTVSSTEDLRSDYDAFLSAEDVEIGPPRLIPFPNFTRRAFFDGAVFRIGNSASFLEPLEATGLTFVLAQLRLASYWILDEALGISGTGRSKECLSTLNDHMLAFVREAALFVSWHYACGSPYRSPFWAFARECFEKSLAEASHSTRSTFFEFVGSGSNFPRDIAFEEDGEVQDHIAGSGPPSSPTTFGGFLDLSFAKVGHGLGFFAHAGQIASLI